MALVWIAEDDDCLVDLLHFVLEQAGFSVEAFNDGGAVLQAVAERLPDLLVLDLGLPRVDGHRVCEALRQNPLTSFLPVLILTGRKDVADRYRSFANGADDYLTKPFDGLELILRIRNRLRRARLVSGGPVEERLRVGDVELDLANHRVRAGSRSSQLTGSEFAILRMLMSSPGRAVDVEALLTEALGYPPRLGNPEILRTHVRNLRQKLEDDPGRPRRLINLPRLGYLVNAEPALDADRIVALEVSGERPNSNAG
ncbi:MAG: response regulator transcription factor [Candidatus Sericytochromatia bacterium]|nr:response regulator transcription factor [Candidatus Tanganyikabacteria bacterium]